MKIFVLKYMGTFWLIIESQACLFEKLYVCALISIYLQTKAWIKSVHHINLACLIKPANYFKLSTFTFKVSKFQLKYLHLYYEDEWKSYRFGTACRGVNDDRIFILGFLNSLKTTFQWINHITTSLSSSLQSHKDVHYMSVFACVSTCMNWKEASKSSTGYILTLKNFMPMMRLMMLCTTWGLCSFSLSSFSSVMNFLRTAWNLHTNTNKCKWSNMMKLGV